MALPAELQRYLDATGAQSSSPEWVADPETGAWTQLANPAPPALPTGWRAVGNTTTDRPLGIFQGPTGQYYLSNGQEIAAADVDRQIENEASYRQSYGAQHLAGNEGPINTTALPLALRLGASAILSGGVGGMLGGGPGGLDLLSGAPLKAASSAITNVGMGGSPQGALTSALGSVGTSQVGSILGSGLNTLQNALGGGTTSGGGSVTTPPPTAVGGWNSDGGSMADGGYSYDPDLGDQQMVGANPFGSVGGNVYDPDLADKQMVGSYTGGTSVPSGGAATIAALLKALGLGGNGSTGGIAGLGTGAGSQGGQLGSILASILGYSAANSQTAAFKSLADQYAGYGAPYRQKLSDLYSNPSSFLTSPEVTAPVQQGTDMLARSLSVQGNPVGSGNALQQLQNYSANQLFGRLGEEKNRLGSLGGIANFNAAAPTAASSAIQSSGNAANAIGAGVNNLFNPVQSLSQQLAPFMNLQQNSGL